MNDITSLHLKTALLYYYRFKKQYMVVDEVYSICHEKADILIDTKKAIYEIEIKLNKADLRAEKKKKKHNFKNLKQLGANQFYICTPTYLVSYALEWIKEINPKYGLIEFNTQYYIERKARYNITEWDKCLRFRKKASRLHNKYNVHLRKNIIKRLSSALVNAYIDMLEGIDQRERDKK